MAYSTGTVNDMTALRAAIVAACVTDGWTAAGEVLLKDGMALRLQVVSGTLRLTGGTGVDGSNNLTGAASSSVHVGGLGIVFPATYEIFGFASEIYVVINYAVDRYQWCAWGKSSVAGVGGSGMWLSATHANSLSTLLAARPESGSLSYSSGALFWYSRTGPRTASTHIHKAIDGVGWASGTDLFGATDAARPLIKILPNSWNSEAVLIPARLYLGRASSKYSLVAEAENARHTRIDNYSPGQIVTIGSDRWKILPWYRKEITERDGGLGAIHTGTLGWAIRYEGP